jgi:hypothetical protein
VTRVVVVKPPWLTRRIIRAPFKRLRFLGATAVSRSLAVTVRARLAVVDPVATTTGLPLRLRILAGTVPEIWTLPARATLTRRVVFAVSDRCRVSPPVAARR